MVTNTNYPLPAGHTLTVSVGDGTAHVQQREDAAIAARVTNARPVVFGPYQLDRMFRLQENGNATVTIAEAQAAVPASGAVTDIVDMSGTEAPVAPVQATKNVNPAGDDNGLTFTAVEYGEKGNDISIAYVDPGGVSATLAVTVADKAIAVSLGRATSAINSTAADVLAAIEAHARASELVTVAIMTSDTGSGDDGSGVVTAMAAANLASGAGTGVNVAGPGSRYTVTGEEPEVYINTGTKAQPEWSLLAFD